MRDLCCPLDSSVSNEQLSFQAGIIMSGRAKMDSEQGRLQHAGTGALHMECIGIMHFPALGDIMKLHSSLSRLSRA